MPPVTVLSGELGLLSLFDLGQLLMLNGATGQMTVVHEGRRGYFYFDRGQIVNAIDDEHHEGENAAYRVFTWKSGTFEFQPGASTGSCAINDSTEGLMMEAARRMDEQGSVGSGGELDKLAQRASSLEALRDAFQSVASETRVLPELEAGGGGSAFAKLRDPADALLFRPGHVPRLRVGGRWRAAGGGALDPAAYDQLRARLLDGVKGAAGAPAREAGVHTCVITGEDGRRYAVARVAGEHEAMWVRAAGLPPPEPAQFAGPLDTWRGALAGTAGLLLVSGPDAATAERLFHASVAQLARSRPGVLLLAADHDRWAHADEGGVLLRAGEAEAPALLRALAPDCAAFDLAHAALSADALHTAARVVAAVVAADAAGALATWCARTGHRWGDGIEARLPGGYVDIVFATGECTPEGSVPFDVARLAFATAPAAVETAAEPRPAAEPDVPASVPARAEAADEPEPVREAIPAAEPGPAAVEDAPEPAPGPLPSDPMAALAAELSRSLRKAA